MPSMTSYDRGSVVLVSFLFPDQRGAKRRPAVVVSTRAYHQGRQEVIISAVTSNLARMLPGDTVLNDWTQGGLLRPSVATGIIRTVKQSALLRNLGSLSTADLRAVDENLSLALGL